MGCLRVVFSILRGTGSQPSGPSLGTAAWPASRDHQAVGTTLPPLRSERPRSRPRPCRKGRSRPAPASRGLHPPPGETKSQQVREERAPRPATRAGEDQTAGARRPRVRDGQGRAGRGAGGSAAGRQRLCLPDPQILSDHRHKLFPPGTEMESNQSCCQKRPHSARLHG